MHQSFMSTMSSILNSTLSNPDSDFSEVTHADGTMAIYIGVIILVALLGAHWIYFFGFRAIPFLARKNRTSGKYAQVTSVDVNLALEDLKTNSAFVLLKPHASTEAAVKMAIDYFQSNRIVVSKQGRIDLTPANAAKLFDLTYAEECRYATSVRASDIVLTEKMRNDFFLLFGREWADCIKNDLIFNAKDACEHFQLNPFELIQAWLFSARQGKCLALSRDLKCAYVTCVPGKPPIYCINGDYLSLREDFAESSREVSSVYYFYLDWRRDSFGWREYFEDIIGDEDPARARAGTLRARMLKSWQDLGMAAPPDGAKNCVYASDSALKALVDKATWVPGTDPQQEPIGRFLIGNGIKPDAIRALVSNPVIKGNTLFAHVQFADVKQSVITFLGLMNKKIK